MQKILIYSDCFIFSGSENVIENILKSGELNEQYHISFYYAYSETYQEAITRKFPNIANIHPVSIFSAFNKWGYRVRMKRSRKDGVYYRLLLRYIIGLFFEKMGFYDLSNWWTLFRLFKHQKPNILYINNGGYPGARSCRIGVISARCAGIKNIAFNVNNLATAPKNIMDKWLDIYINKFVKTFITASNAAGLELIRARKFNGKKLINIPNTLLKSHEIRARTIRGGGLKDFQIESGELLLGSIGLLTYRKGYHVLIEAVRQLKESVRDSLDFKVVIFGEGEDRLLLENMISRYGLERTILLPGFKNDIFKYVKDFDIFVVPSIANEDFPYVILEAMLLGKPIIGTSIAGIPEQVTHGYNGWIVPANNSKKLSEAIEKLINDKSLIMKMGENSYKKYIENYSNNGITERYRQLFEILEGNENTIRSIS